LLSYRDARPRARQIAEVTRRRTMPPWLPVSGRAELVGARRLPDDRIDLLQRWYEQGAPEGPPAELPPPPRFPEGWQLGEPDLVLELGPGFTLAAEGLDVIRNFVLPAPTSERRWVEGVEIRPGDKRIVHHAVLKVDRTPRSRTLDARDAEPGFDGMEMGNAENPDGHILVWTPGAPPYVAEPGTAWSLDAGDDLVLQLHLVPVGRSVPVGARVGLHLAEGPPRRETFAVVLREDRIDIPAGAREYLVEDRLTLPVDVDAVAIYPHAHYLGKTMRVMARLPDGRERSLLRIDDWDFNWQGMYRYVEPQRLPAGTTVSLRFTYDNSASNPRNPNVPPRRVVGGNRSSDEMGNLALQVIPVDPADLGPLREANWRAMLAKNPQDTGALFNLGVECARRGDHREAATHYERVLRLDPLDVGALVALAGAHVKLGEPARAIERYEAALRLEPDHAHALFVLGWLLADGGRLDEAAARLERSLALDPAQPLAWHRLGVVDARRGDRRRAIEHYREALRLDPDLAVARRDLERALAAAGP
jgi:Flp pilus assembly protein TadD